MNNPNQRPPSGTHPAAPSVDPTAADEWVVPFPKPKDQIADAQSFRSTWITASQATLRDLGHGDRYEAAIDPRHREAVLSVVPGVWLPMEVARAHYLAADSLRLPEADLVEIGAGAMRRANATALAVVKRVAQATGISPMTVLRQANRLWKQTCDGGFIGVARLGPNEARVEIVGLPIAGIRYVRVSFRGIALGALELFCEKVLARDVPPLCNARTLVMRVHWA